MAATEVYGHLGALDIVVVALYLLFSVGLGILFSKRGTSDSESYFIGGRGMSWWLIGVSLAATCFAADTPLWIGDIVYRRGFEGMWLYWIIGIGFAFYVFAIAPLWRRSRIVTDLEFLELRYSGPAATWMRGFSSLYYSLFFNVMMMAVGTLSITTIMQATTGMPKLWCIVITVGAALVYCMISGLWGVAATDFMQFFVAVIGSALLAFFSVRAVGGVAPLLEFLQTQREWPGHRLNLMPGGGSMGLPMMTVFFIVGLRWLDNAAIGAYVSQRLFAARSVRHATMGAMLHAMLYWSIVPLPWIITIAAARMHLPQLTDGQQAYPRMAMAVLPVGLKGLLVASMLAAFMSTYSTLLSWGSSYAINDLYKRFLRPNAAEKHYVRIGQAFMIPLGIVSAYIAYRSENIFNLLTYIFLLPAALWTVQVARWLWWRVNAWAELWAWIGGLLMIVYIALFQQKWLDPQFNEQYWGHKFIVIIGGSTVIWLVAMLLTRPSEPEHLAAFVRRVRPIGFWRAQFEAAGVQPTLSWGRVFQGWGIMLMAIFGPAIGLVQCFLGRLSLGLGLLTVGVAGIIMAFRHAGWLARQEAFEESEAGLNEVPNKVLQGVE